MLETAVLAQSSCAGEGHGKGAVFELAIVLDIHVGISL